MSEESGSGLLDTVAAVAPTLGDLATIATAVVSIIAAINTFVKVVQKRRHRRAEKIGVA